VEPAGTFGSERVNIEEIERRQEKMNEDASHIEQAFAALVRCLHP
jgi:hypothetical protein